MASFRDLIVWQKAVKMSLAIYRLTSAFPSSEQFGLTNQMRRAAVSVANNVAEGYGRSTKGEYLQFLGHARGSIFELQTQLVISKELSFGTEQAHNLAEGLSSEVGRMLNAMMNSLHSADFRSRPRVLNP
jgi:four helix bundle protein